MIYCDIGNSSVDLFQNGEREKFAVRDFDPTLILDNVYFVSVNHELNLLLKNQSNWHDLKQLINWDKYYSTMGIDRIMVCEAVDDGVIVDAGSAITVDVMRGGIYQGGFISLGIRAAEEAYARVSPALDVSFNFEVDLAKMAKNTPDAVVVGFLAPLVEKIERLGKPLYITGGDARLISRFFSEAIVDEDLIFKGMTKLIEKGVKC